MTVVHIVLFKFQSSAGEVGVKTITEAMLALKDRCLHPATQQPYIQKMSGGLNNSTEGHDNGFTHAFVMEFENTADRDYYIEKDPVHLAFIAQASNGFVEKACVVDYTIGKFD